MLNRTRCALPLVVLLAAAPAFGKGAAGLSCKWGSDCLSGKCKFGKCASASGSTKSAGGVACKWPSECESGKCSFGKCAASGGGSTKGSAGVACSWPSECASGNCSFGVCKGDAKGKSAPSGSGARGAPEEPVAEEQPAYEEPVPEPTDCSRDLMAAVFKDKADSPAYLRIADKYCRDYTSAQLSQAKEIYALGYKDNISDVLKTIASASPAELACVKKEFEAMPKDKWRLTSFEVRASCRARVDASPCATDLMATVYKEKKDLKLWTDYAERDCKKNTPEQIAAAKTLFTAGYGVSFSGLIRELARATPEQVDCGKAEWDSRKPENKKDQEFLSNGDGCKKKKK
jgi:hypothetical protein